MKEKNIFLDFEMIDRYQTALNNNSVGIEGVVGEATANFMDLKKNNIYNNGLNQLENGLVRLKDTLNNCNQVLGKFKENFLLYENNQSLEIEKIEIPKNFLITDAMEVHTTKDTNLNKQDGKSINEGTDNLENNKFSDNTYVNINSNLIKDINSETGVQVQNLDETTKIHSQKQLHDINNNNRLNIQNINDSTKIQTVNLNNIINSSNIPNQKDINFMQNVSIENKKEIEGDL